MSIEFFYDIVSPYSYLAATQIARVEAETGTEVRYRPFFLGGAMSATGNSPPAQLAPRARAMFKDLRRWAARYDVPLQLPADFPANTLLAMRTLVQLEGQSLRKATDLLFAAHWGKGQSVSSVDAISAELGDDVEGLSEALAQSGTAGVKAKLREVTEEAVDRGAYGAPTFFVGEEMFFGNDRLDFLIEALQ